MKKLIASLIVFSLILTFTGCSSKSSNDSTVSSTEAEEKFPNKSIEIVCPYGAGGDTDYNSRMYAQYLPEALDTSVVVTNTTGSGGVVGSRSVKDAQPDGYKVLFMHPALIVNEVAGASNYGLDDFEIPCITGMSPGEIITVRSDSGFKTLDDLYKYTKTNPGKIKVAADVGTMTHVMTLQMVKEGFDINIVSAGGAAERISQLLGGHIDVIINSYGTVADYFKTGELVALGQTNTERSEAFPEIKTCLEQGYDVQFEKYYFVAMPKGTPQNILDTFSEAVKEVVENQEYKDSIFKSYGQIATYMTQEEAKDKLLIIEEMVKKYQDNF